MRHKVSKPKLNRAKGPRKALQVNQLSSLVRNEYITTTVSKARAVRSLFERVISVAKKNDDAAKKHVASILTDKLALEKIFKIYLPRFETRNSGFTTSVKVGFRAGDNAEMVKVIVMGYQEIKEEKEKAKAKAKVKTKTKTKSTTKSKVKAKK